MILDHGPGQGRRALTLLPDQHVRMDIIVIGTRSGRIGVAAGAWRAVHPKRWTAQHDAAIGSAPKTLGRSLRSGHLAGADALQAESRTCNSVRRMTWR
ncbi:hypothetical protein ACFYOA_18350 [Streptomyces iakyrus]|uniref:hypothetical protein n=1 Tax=Streptomyces iakyrus TaxID=68219 RepID=UPI00367DDDA3